MGIQRMMYNGLSGLNLMSGSMSVIGDNIANVNTTSFKESLQRYQDALPATFDSLGQIGTGVREYSLSRSFTAGSLETTSQSTDMAIGGQGFFMLRAPETSTADLYTRDGQFGVIGSTTSPDTLLNLTNASGYFVQGINMGSTASPTGTVEDIQLSKISLPKSTENVTVTMNLENDASALESTSSPLYANWDGTNITGGTSSPIAETDYNYQNTIQIYDGSADGNPYDLTIYIDNTTNGSEKEFLVTCDPTLDQRLIGSTGSRYNEGSVPSNKGAGALLYGIMSFSPTGELNDISCWDVPADGNLVPTEANKIQLDRGEGYYSFDYNFSGTGDNLSSTLSFGTTPSAQTVTSSGGALSTVDGDASPLNSEQTTWAQISDADGNQVQDGDVLTFSGTDGDGTPVSLNYTVDLTNTVGDLLTALSTQFNCDASLTDGKLQLEDNTIGTSQLAVTALSYQDNSGLDPTGNPALAQVFGDDGGLFSTVPSAFNNPAAISTTNYATKSVTLYQVQDGYGSGYLEDISVDENGVVSGIYSNDQTIAQAQVMLADFTNYDGLVAGEGNSYWADNTVGLITIGAPGEGTMGTVNGNSLEMSNVDLTHQFVNMIATQRVFQANSVSITTADEIYQKTLALI